MPYKSKKDRNEWNRRRNEINRKQLDELRSKPCVDCGGIFPPWIMEFDHVPSRGKKAANVSCIVGATSIIAPSVRKEIEKCDLVCANCHKTRTHFRGQQSFSLRSLPEKHRPHKAGLAGSNPAVGTSFAVLV